MKTILTIILTICTFKGFSCTCNPDLTDKELIGKSEYAFIAEVISNVYKDGWTKQFIGEKGIRTDAKVRIVKLLKGNILTEEVIVISSESSSCEINLIPGKQYLITGTEKYNKLAPAISDTPAPVELNSTFDPDTSIFEQPKIKSKNEWIEELQQTNLVVFTSVCQTRYRK